MESGAPLDGQTEQSATDDRSSDSHPLAESSAEVRNQFQLEGLEPRILLSADPISAELARVLDTDGLADAADQPAAIVQEIDASLKSDLGLGAERDSSGQLTEADETAVISVNWPQDWQIIPDNIAHQNGAAAYLLINGVETDAHAATVTSAQLQPLFQFASQLWSEFAPELAHRLTAIEVQITDLPGGILGKTEQQTISIDANAAGRGWFVDTTPDDTAEFGGGYAAEILTAETASDASGLVDLLTVVVHELGHALGFDHDSALPVMDEVLGEGVRLDLRMAQSA
jgi:hypothetical protein